MTAKTPVSTKPAAPPNLREALIEENKAETRLRAALKREYPVGASVSWMIGAHEQRGRVVDHSRYDARLLAENVRTGKQRWLGAAEIHRAATGEWL